MMYTVLVVRCMCGALYVLYVWCGAQVGIDVFFILFLLGVHGERQRVGIP